jgi:pseudouridine synthase
MDIDGYMIEPVKTETVGKREDSTVLQMTLYEGKNRQIRKMCEKVGLDIVFLKRIAVGEIRLSGLRLGKWTYLTKNQINYLERMLNEDDAGVTHKG